MLDFEKLQQNKTIQLSSRRQSMANIKIFKGGTLKFLLSLAQTVYYMITFQMFDLEKVGQRLGVQLS